MKDCTGIEIAEELLYHMGVTKAEIHYIAVNSANTIPCAMPYVMSYFMSRAMGDIPHVVPKGSVNMHSLGTLQKLQEILYLQLNILYVLSMKLFILYLM